MTGLVVDNFAGGGGASLGIEKGLGRRIDVAINHDPVAVGVHRANHPDTLHLAQDIWSVDAAEVCAGRPVDFAWFSPDCRHFSKAKGGKPVSIQVRDLAWVVHRWAELPRWQRPKVLMLENVEEFRDWGPVCVKSNKPIKERRGETFRRWVYHLERLGYDVQCRELRACDYGAPTIRKRLFVIARCDGGNIIWPAPTHGDPKSLEVASGQLQPWRTASEIIDWSLPCPSIFLSKEESKTLGIKRPLAEATMRRIARGVQRFVLDDPNPFILGTAHGEGQGRGVAEWDAQEPLRVVTGTPDKAIAMPFVAPLTHHGERRHYPISVPLPTVTAAHRGEYALIAPVVTYGQQGGANRRADAPMHTITASRKDTNMVVVPFLTGVGGRMAQTAPRGTNRPYHTTTAKADAVLIAPTLVQTGYGERKGQAPRAPGLKKPLGPVVGGGAKHALVSAFLTKFCSGAVGSSMKQPTHTITANSFIKRPGGAAPVGVVAGYLAQHNGGMTGHRATKPVSTITQKGSHQQLVAAHLLNQKGSDQRMNAANGPCPTVCANGNHVAAVAAFLSKYYGQGVGASLKDPTHTCTVKERFSLVTVEIAGAEYVLADIGMRMLVPMELAGAQGFPKSYVIDREWDGTPVTKTNQVRLVGNSVCPDLAEVLSRANCGQRERRAAA